LNLTVIKLGGSLMRSSELSSWLESIEAESNNSNIVIVPGGGEFADSVRSFQETYQFNDLVAHRMALLAMCQYGYLLAGLNQKLKIVQDISLISSYSGKKVPLIWLPMTLIEDDSEISANWDFTSDSIALWLATRLKAQKLILVKSKYLDNDKSLIINHIKNNALDKGFQELMGNYSGEIYFMEKGQHQLLSNWLTN
jgi:5-(aminomethyl)-3-furanmethanol phosphate kinase